MARATNRRHMLGFTLAAWSVALLVFFPILWTFLTSFKTEGAAVALPPKFLFFHWTTENYAEVWRRTDYLRHLGNSAAISLGSTMAGLCVGIPAAWSMAFSPTRRTRFVLLWMLSTKMLPPVGALVPVYLMFKRAGLLDTRTGLIIVLMLSNLPIVVWMLFTYFKEIPRTILEAARMDGASPGRELLHVLAPMALPGIASTLLLNVILAWNESFWALNLTAASTGPLPAFIAAFSAPEGLFYAKLSAASMLAVAPVIVLGWLSQKQLVRGLTFGAVK